MDYDALVTKVIALLQREQRVPYRALKRRFELDDEYIEDLKDELIYAKKLAMDEDNRLLVGLERPVEHHRCQYQSTIADLPPSPAPPSTSQRKFSPRAAPWKGNASR
jgi:predicted Zn-ribbon and HTH transcriptional regulator